jgi:D-alanyl-D-alanine carboxypeptidase/D-alanyl-D-alanine-endopeptidase (penicillin-binding protein 4)
VTLKFFKVCYILGKFVISKFLIPKYNRSKMRKFSFSLLLVTTLISSAYSSQLPENMTKIMQQPKYKHSNWGIYVKDSVTGQELFDLNSDLMFLPASTTKLFSVSALLNAYGDDYRFKTPVYAVGEVVSGKLNGVLILVGQGDLTFGGRQSSPDTIAFTNMDHIIANDVPGVSLTPQDPLAAITSLAKQVKASGIEEINGDVLIDDRLFEIVAKRGMILSPIMINENMLDFTINPSEAGQPATVVTRPEVKGYSIKNNLMTVAKDEPLQIEITSDETGGNIVISGSIPADKKDIVRTFSIKNPNLFARNAFLEALEKQGVKVNISVDKKIKMPEKQELAKLQPVALFTSPPLTEYAKLILKVSHNMGADLIPLLLSAKAGNSTFDEGMKLLGDFVTTQVGISKNAFVFIDGAGGDENRLTPKAEVQLLEYVKKQDNEHFKKFYDALPILGVDGSLADFGKKTQAVNKARAKTGTGVAYNLATQNLFLTTQALTGYVEGKNDHLYEFMIVVNNAEMPTIDDIFAIFEDLSEMTGIVYDHTGQ